MPKVNVKVPKLNGFDRSFKHLLTSKVGTLTPILTRQLPPSTKVNLKTALMCQLPPLATDTFMRVNLKVEAFFVPSRLLYAGYTDWLMSNPLHDPQHEVDMGVPSIPRLFVQGDADLPLADPNTLLDYLGLRCKRQGGPVTNVQVNIFPLLAYHRIYDDWYRNPNVQAPVFAPPTWTGATQSIVKPYHLPYVTFTQDEYPDPIFYLSQALGDGVNLGALRQRNFGFDYFTNAMPSPQRGNPLKVTIDSEDDSFTIASLRAANSLQQFAERNMLAGARWQDFLKANYNADLSDGVAQRAIYLGSGEVPVYNKSVLTTAPNSLIASAQPNQNPFGGPQGAVGQAAKYGDASAQGEITLVENFTTNEPGYLMVLASLVPIVTYGAGIDRMFFRDNANDAQPDLATPILQNVGNQPIYRGELTGRWDKSVFGYTDRYADFKSATDELSGLVRDGENLSAFALQRVVGGEPEISAEFLQIPTNYMDQVTVVKSWLSQYGYWLDAYFDFKVAMPLDGYSLPSLQDPAYEHGVDVQVDTNGRRIA